jgi:hypothetical protein
MPKIEKKNRGSRGKVDTLKTQSLTPNLQDLIKSEILLLYNVQIVLCKPGPTKDYTNDMCCFFVKHTTLRIKNIDCLDWNQDNVSEWRNSSTRGAVKIKLCVFV